MPKPKNPADTLRAARKLIEREKNWTQGETRRVSGFWPVLHTSYCAWAAIRKIDGPYEEDAMYLLAQQTNFNIARWNDLHNRTHAEVLAAFDKAIELAEQEPNKYA